MVRHQVNDLVVYGSNGVFRIDGVCKRKLTAARRSIMCSSRCMSMACPPPTCRWKTEQLTAKLRPLLSRQEVVELIDSLPHMQTPWIESQDIRREKYREILHKGDRTAMIRAIRALHLHRREQEALRQAPLSRGRAFPQGGRASPLRRICRRFADGAEAGSALHPAASAGRLKHPAFPRGRPFFARSGFDFHIDFIRKSFYNKESAVLYCAFLCFCRRVDSDGLVFMRKRAPGGKGE